MKNLAHVFLLAIIGCLISCGESVKYEESSNYSLTFGIFELPSTGQIHADSIQPIDSIFVREDSLKKISIATYQNNRIISDQDLSEAFFLRFWEFGEDRSVIGNYTIKASEGISPVICHYSIDSYNDTASICAPVLIDSIEHITLLEPENKSNKGLGISTNFKVLVSGIESWENAKCELYVSSSLQKLWNQSSILVSEFNCNEVVSASIQDSTSNIIHYWGVKATINSHQDVREIYSEPFEIYALPAANESATVMRILYQNTRNKARKGFVEIYENNNLFYVDSINGDTTLILRNLKENSEYTAIIRESIRTDYAKESVNFKTIPGIYTVLEPIILKDNVAPEAIPLKRSFARNDSICFFATENGSGLNALRTTVIQTNNRDTLSYKFLESKLAFFLDCNYDCEVMINLEDNAGNKSPLKSWKFSFTEDSIKVKGPFIY